MCKNYGNDNFKKYTLYQFNLCFKDGKVKNSLMGFYSWLIKISKENIINLSKELITKLWNRKQSKKASRENTTYKKVNASTVLRWLQKLENAKLLFVDRTQINNKYILNADGSIHPNIFSQQKKCTEKCTTEKRLQDVATTSVQELDDVYKNNKLNTINKDIDILSNNSCQDHTTVNNFNYKSYLDKQEKVSSVNEMQKIIEQGFKIMHVRSNKIKGNVLGNVLNYYNTITKNKALNYVFAAINNARDLYYKKHKEDWFGKKNTQIDTFDNYEQRNNDIVLNKLKKLGY
ncbi:plasmid replication protein [Clostridium botulinum]|uniref:hypothetical protein n=1 Tax=Clostridium botulinum TaxID=1491 RepID=UPI0002075AA7|nr:hypothetical protein [Clostridium botulinum]AEB77614.1 plasmid replication protein [Clostridium botulinum BKT015925]KLU74179.1 plasmid replication protein [Clostridium botulinum V891]KOA76616.1 plasmid replication protein [Clostridium botulinum]KOA86426.1 plasmid replication protein [Clostridium botulinum]KOC34073.1 plasmid replication protein [Clostridium botulinum]